MTKGTMTLEFWISEFCEITLSGLIASGSRNYLSQSLALEFTISGQENCWRYWTLSSYVSVMTLAVMGLAIHMTLKWKFIKNFCTVTWMNDGSSDVTDINISQL